MSTQSPRLPSSFEQASTSGAHSGVEIRSPVQLVRIGRWFGSGCSSQGNRDENQGCVPQLVIENIKTPSRGPPFNSCTTYSSLSDPKRKEKQLVST